MILVKIKICNATAKTSKPMEDFLLMTQIGRFISATFS